MQLTIALIFIVILTLFAYYILFHEHEEDFRMLMDPIQPLYRDEGSMDYNETFDDKTFETLENL